MTAGETLQTQGRVEAVSTKDSRPTCSCRASAVRTSDKMGERRTGVTDGKREMIARARPHERVHWTHTRGETGQNAKRFRRPSRTAVSKPQGVACRLLAKRSDAEGDLGGPKLLRGTFFPAGLVKNPKQTKVQVLIGKSANRLARKQVWLIFCKAAPTRIEDEGSHSILRCGRAVKAIGGRHGGRNVRRVKDENSMGLSRKPAL